ncbi:MAG: helix-turn-helix transcriptional regulator [Ruminococcus sp.]|nr:helix-turn-helix transcriptional regulator [Ruminococcus sp.]
MLGANIRKLREARRLSQTELAKALSVSKQSVSNWENKNIVPSVEMLLKIAKYFSVTPNFLLGIYTKEYINTEGLTTEQITSIKLVIDTMKNK